MPRLATSDYGRAAAGLRLPDGRPLIPSHPALRPEVTARRDGEELRLDGGEPTGLRGRRTLAALDRLLPLLDGHRDEAALAAGAGLPVLVIRQLLGTLVLRGALQDGPVPAADAGLRYLSRAVARTGWHDRGDQAQGVLRAARVRVIGCSALAAGLRAGLAGVVELQADGPADLVCVVDGPLETTQTPTLAIHLTGSALVCGPYLVAGGATCADCAQLEISQLPPGNSVPDPALLAGLAVGEVLNLLGGLGRSVSDSTLIRHDPTEWRTEVFDVLGRPGCSSCRVGDDSNGDADGDDSSGGDGTGGDDGALALVRRYEAASALPGRRWLPPAMDREHYRPAHLAAQLRFTRAGGTARPAGPIGELLRTGVGLRGPVSSGLAPDRWAPSAGNLGSVVGYCVGPDGASQYDPLGHELVRLDWQESPVDAITVVLTSDLTKLMPKYGPKSYRLSYLEAGAGLAQIALAAGAQGYGVRGEQPDDQRWSVRLGTDTRSELLCTAATLSPPPGRPGPPPPPGRPTSARSAAELADRCPTSRAEIGARLARAIRSGPVARPVPRPPEPAPGRVFPRLVRPDTIAARRSHRSFAAEPVAEEVVVRAIENGLTAQAELWPATAPLAVLVLADRVAGQPAGVLHYSAGRLLRLGPLPAPGPELILQPELAAAAAVVVWFADLTTAVAQAGVAGYRQALVQGGAAAAICALTAAEGGLGGCLFDGLLPAGRQFPLHEARRRPLALCAVALGGPAQHDDDPAGTKG